MKRVYEALLESKEERWDQCRGGVADCLRELAEHHGGEVRHRGHGLQHSGRGWVCEVLNRPSRVETWASGSRCLNVSQHKLLNAAARWYAKRKHAPPRRHVRHALSVAVLTAVSTFDVALLPQAPAARRASDANLSAWFTQLADQVDALGCGEPSSHRAIRQVGQGSWFVSGLRLGQE